MVTLLTWYPENTYHLKPLYKLLREPPKVIQAPAYIGTVDTDLANCLRQVVLQLQISAAAQLVMLSAEAALSKELDYVEQLDKEQRNRRPAL